MAKQDEDEDKRPDPEEEPEEGSADEDEGEEDESEDESESEASDTEETADEEEEDEEESESDQTDEDEDDEEDEEDEREDKAAATEGEDLETLIAKSGDESEGDEADAEEVPLVTQLGAQRYVYSAFFACMIVGGFVLGRAIESIWQRLAVSDWAVNNVPAITGVPDDTKATYSFLVAGLVAVIVGIRTFRKEHVRRWAEEVSSELLKVKWPTRKEVYSSVVVVIATSAVAVTYMFLLDRFWGFITDKIYGFGS